MTTDTEHRRYLSGYGNEHSTEARAGALPIGRFSPQRCPFGLYAEKFSSTAFTAPRAHNRRTWLYRIRPSVVGGRPEPVACPRWQTGPGERTAVAPDQLRWDPLPIPSQRTDFADGLQTIALNGDARAQTGIGIHIYTANASMDGRFLYNADGEFLLLPQQGGIELRTECGILALTPGEVAVVPRGMKFSVHLDGPARGYVCENYGAPFALPERGPVGSDGFANDRDFLYPVAHYEDREGEFELLTRFGGSLYTSRIGHSPLDVVAWTGNSAPYKYDLRRFNVIGSISFDHPDPSIFTVLTSASDTPGVANADFVIFPDRWMVAENTFRPPWFHRNIMSEYMGLIFGEYDAKEGGFLPGGGSLHNCMTPHGPDAEAFARATAADLQPAKYTDTLAFMLESRYLIEPTRLALGSDSLQRDYPDCWQGLTRQFDSR